MLEYYFRDKDRIFRSMYASISGQGQLLDGCRKNRQSRKVLRNKSLVPKATRIRPTRCRNTPGNKTRFFYPWISWGKIG